MLLAARMRIKFYLPDEQESNHVILSTIIGARSITYPNLRFVIIHPAMRTQAMGPSGLDGLVDVPVSAELRGNMQGRVGRNDSGLITYLFDFDDSLTALQVLNGEPDFRVADLRTRDSSRSRSNETNFRAPPMTMTILFCFTPVLA